METNISIVSTGPDRKETIDINGTLSNIWNFFLKFF
jgi:adenylosuccinate synthase